LDLAALGFAGLAGLLFQRIAEGIVGGEEVPAVATLGYQRAAGADGQGMGVVGPVETVGRTLFAGQLGGGGAGDQVDLLLALGEPLDGERHGGGGQLHDRVDLLTVVPLTGDVGGDVRFVLVVGGDDLD